MMITRRNQARDKTHADHGSERIPGPGQAPGTGTERISRTGSMKGRGRVGIILEERADKSKSLTETPPYVCEPEWRLCSICVYLFQGSDLNGQLSLRIVILYDDISEKRELQNLGIRSE